jgi:hypothetical protein
VGEKTQKIGLSSWVWAKAPILASSLLIGDPMSERDRVDEEEASG